MIALVTVDPGHQLAPAPAAAYLRARAAGAPAGITSSTRTYAEQAVLYAAYLAGTGALASPPGMSVHEKGGALDLPDEDANPRAWSRWTEFGWIRTNAEPWHREYRASADQHLTDAVTAPDPIQQNGDDDMQLVLARLKDPAQPKVFIGDGITRRHVTDQAELKDIQSMMREGVLKGSETVHYVDSLGWLGKEV